jgi:flagellar hook assembly protein FlgD
MMQNYPNPFNQSTTIQVDLPQTSDLNLEIFSSLGERVYSEKIKNKETGQFNIIWDGKTSRGIELPSGIYFFKINTDYDIRVQKLMLVR